MMVLWILSAWAMPCPTSSSSPHADTTHGCVLGLQSQGFDAFLGIPYAEPPVGDRRWAAPEPVAPWGSLRANRLTSQCIQDDLQGSGAFDGDEDCLYLNILRPAGTDASDRLPVLFFTHGGGFARGAGNSLSLIGYPELVTDNQVILVTFDYRLAQLGWLAHPALSDEDPDQTSGNQGIRDTLLALRWTHDNIEAFGGDRDRFMIFGESAGSFMTCELLVAPEAQGLFSAALMESGACMHQHTVLRGPLPPGQSETEEERGRRLASELGCTRADADDELACMRALPPESILSALPPRMGPVNDGELYAPMVDGVVLPMQPYDAFATGQFSQVPIAAGINDDEGTLFTAMAPAPRFWFQLAQELRDYASEAGIADVTGLVDLYGPTRFSTPREAWDAFWGDIVFGCPTRQLLDAAGGWTPTRGYLFSWELSPRLGSNHGGELPFVFGTLSQPSADEARLSDTMGAAWAWLARGSGVGPWPEFGGSAVQGGRWAHFDVPSGVLSGVRQTECDFFDSQGWVSTSL